MAFDPTEIEDGTGKSGAIVYSDVADAVAYLARFTGQTALQSVTGDVAGGGGFPKQEAHLLLGTRYVEWLAIQGGVAGRPTSEAQALLWPREGTITINGDEIANNAIPEDWKRATWEAAELSAAGKKLAHFTISGRELKRQKTSTQLEKEWFRSGTSEDDEFHEAVWSLVAPWVRQSGRGAVRMVRG